jgi:APA family basic amino acid/polyamine antiporter
MSLVVAVLLLFIIIGAFKVDLTRFETFTPFGYNPIFLSLGYVFSIYIGFELITNVSEEVKRAQKIVPRAIMATIVLALLLFPTIIAIMIGVVDHKDIVSSEVPLVFAALEISTSFGFVMAFASIVASLASLNASIIASSRTLFSLSRDRHIPKIFENIHSYFRTPYFSLLFTFALTLSIIFLFHIELIVYISDLAYLLGLTLINPAGILISKKVGRRLGANIIIPLLALISTILILPTITVNAMLVGLILTAIGFILVTLESAVKMKRTSIGKHKNVEKS